MRGQTRQIPQQTINAKASIHNRFDIEVVDGRTGKIKQRAQAENIILNQKWNSPVGNWSSYIHIGSGTGTPAATDTQLFTFIAGIQSTSTIKNIVDKNTHSIQRKITLSEIQYVGQTITEVGVGYGSTASTLCTHAMLKDMNGNQISIAKTNTDIINIYATLFCHFPEIEGIIFYPYTYYSWSSTTEINALAANILGAGLSNADLARYISINNTDQYGNIQSLELGSGSWDQSTKTYTFSMKRLPAGSGNFNGYNNVRVDVTGAYQTYTGGFCVDTSVFSDTQITGESVGTGDGATIEFCSQFPIDRDATIYVDGVVQNEVTIETGNLIKPYNSDTLQFFRSFRLIDGEIYYEYNNGVSNYLAAYPLTSYFENMYSDKIGISKIGKGSYSTANSLALSNDLINWVSIAFSSDIPEEYQNYRYLRVTFSEHGSSPLYQNIIPTMTKTLTANIRFNNPPSSGSVITMDYKTKCIAKDINHVFDLTIAIQFGEYTPS